ncbi:ATP-binding protein [Streptomyces phaeoluteigriseus]
MGAPPRGRIADRINVARDHLFVGREAEQALLRHALAGVPDAPSVLYVHGPGGIGKSAFIRQCAKEAVAVGRTVVHVDGRVVPDAAQAFEKAAETAARTTRALQLIDTFEHCQGLEGWLRDEFLPGLPADVLVVVAGRHAPDVRWSADPGWAGVLKVIALGDLSEGEAETFLAKRGVDVARRGALLAFAAGHPLARRTTRLRGRRSDRSATGRRGSRSGTTRSGCRPVRSSSNRCRTSPVSCAPPPRTRSPRSRAGDH